MDQISLMQVEQYETISNEAQERSAKTPIPSLYTQTLYLSKCKYEKYKLDHPLPPAQK
jgi:hypothetical protein